MIKSIVVLLLFILGTFHHSLSVTRMQKDASIKVTTCNPTGPSDSLTIGYGNCFNNIYYINIEVGTPAQTMGVHLDTGSNILWVPTQFVTTISPTFDATQSSTFTNTTTPGSVNYVDGSGVSGTYGTDFLHITNSLINITATYLWVTQESNSNYPVGVQGLIGMGYTNTNPNFLDVAFSNGAISSPVFALQILSDTSQSLIHYNQIPQTIIDASIFEPVSSSLYWGVSVTGVSVGGIDMTSFSSHLAVIDSGTSYFYLNTNLFNNVISNFFSDCTLVSNVTSCPCTSTPNWPTFAFNFTNVEVFIEPADYTINVSAGVCSYLFGSISTVSEILLGDIFFRNYIITFDKPNSQIGFSGIRMTNITSFNPVTPVVPATQEEANVNIMIGWSLLGVLAIVIVIGTFGCCCMQSAGDELVEEKERNPDIEMSNNPTIRPMNPAAD